MKPHTWVVYFLAAVGLSLSPGPNGLLARWATTANTGASSTPASA